MKIVGYVRVSTDKQADRGISLDAQAEKIRAMAVVHDRGLLDIIVDGGESAKSLKRPGMVKPRCCGIRNRHLSALPGSPSSPPTGRRM
jgi:Resolvase, N terminal domain